MKISSIEKTIDQESFEMVLKLNITLPVIAIIDGYAIMGRHEIATVLGMSLLDELDAIDWKNHPNGDVLK